MKVISLGWGVQSFALAAMAALGELPPVGVAIHADTGFERAETYEFAAQWTPWLEARGVRVVTVSDSPGRTINEWRGVYLPAFTKPIYGGKSGMLRRQCTYRWKIAPVRRWLQSNRDGAKIEQQLGITLDEFQRMKDSDVKYIKNTWPFIERRWTRARVIQWLRENNLGVPVKSSCYICPFHDNQAWREIKRGAAWGEAVRIDKEIRDKRRAKGFLCYLSKDCVPLAEAGFSIQAGMFDDMESAECTGTCFL